MALGRADGWLFQSVVSLRPFPAIPLPAAAAVDGAAATVTTVGTAKLNVRKYPVSSRRFSVLVQGLLVFNLLHSMASRIQFLQQRLRFLQIERVKPFGEPAVNRSEQFASLLRLPLIAPEAREAHCGA